MPFSKQLVGRVAAPCTDNSFGEHGRVQLNGKPLEFYHVIHPSSTQQEVFEEMTAGVTSVGDRYSVCVFAFGQTRPGKADTMDGTECNRGVIIRALEKSFEIDDEPKSHSDISIIMSILEIYNEYLRDLISTKGGAKRNSELEIRNTVSFFSLYAWEDQFDGCATCHVRVCEPLVEPICGSDPNCDKG